MMMKCKIVGIAALLLMVLTVNVQAQSRKQAEQPETAAKEEKGTILSIFKKESTEKEDKEATTYKELKEDHKIAKSEVRASKKERKAAEAKERAARARAAAIRADKRAAKAEKKAGKAEGKADKARNKQLKWTKSKKEH